jgi:DNA polymerase-3 subunit epsilon
VSASMVANGTGGPWSFAVLAIDSSGLHPAARARLSDVALVRIESDAVAGELVAQVDPQAESGVGTRAGAVPSFAHAAAEIASLLEGAVLVSHDLRLARAFLEAEFDRLGVAVPPLPTLSTLDLAYRLSADPSRRLSWCGREAGLEIDTPRDAPSTAHAVALLLRALLRRAGDARLPLGIEGRPPLCAGWAGSLRPPARSWAPPSRWVRDDALARLVRRLPGDDAEDSRQAEYMALLDRALERRCLSPADGRALVAIAARWGLSPAEAHVVHRVYLTSLTAEAIASGVLTAELEWDLRLVCDLLGLPRRLLDRLLGDPDLRPTPPPPLRGESLWGRSVCFSEPLTVRLNGTPMSREMAERLAQAAGLVVHPRVTTRLDILVCADPNGSSTQLLKAREYGRRILPESAFWQAIGVAVESPSHGPAVSR